MLEIASGNPCSRVYLFSFENFSKRFPCISLRCTADFPGNSGSSDRFGASCHFMPLFPRVPAQQQGKGRVNYLQGGFPCETSKTLVPFRWRRFTLRDCCFSRKCGGKRRNLLMVLFPWRCVREGKSIAAVFPIVPLGPPRRLNWEDQRLGLL